MLTLTAIPYGLEYLNIGTIKREEFKMDIFETLKSMLGCLYISDLRFAPYKETALELLKEITADSNQIVNAYNYILGGM